MLATAGPLPPPPGTDRDWAYEAKWDGVRAVAYIADGTLRLMSRSDRPIADRYPELAGLRRAVAEPVVVDGEVVAFDPASGAPSFHRLQQRMHLAAPPAGLIAAVRSPTWPSTCCTAGEQLLRPLPYADRRVRLDRLGLAGPAWQTPPAWVGGGADVLAASRQQGLEGVVAKRLSSRYRPGQRSRDWIKTRVFQQLRVVVGGWTPGQGRRAGGIGSLLLGLPDPASGALVYLGGVGTGFSQAALAELAGRLAELARPDSPFTAGGVPAKVARVACWVLRCSPAT
jgi:bifunctional non-homologous end joining protein LigD